MSNRNCTLTAERLRELLHYDPATGKFTTKASRRGARAGEVGCDNGHGYIRITIDSVQYVAHRLAWLYVHGEWSSEILDHRNGFRSDNRIENIRECNDALNQQNRRTKASHNSVGALGVHRHFDGRYRAKITVNKKQIHLGVFDTAELAHDAYIKAKHELHPFCTI